MAKDSEFRVFPDVDQLSRAAASRFLQLASASIEEAGVFTVALSGGSTPKTLYSLLADEPYRSQLPWDRIHFFWGDERCVPPNDPQSNFRMASEALLTKIPVPPANIHRIKGEMEPFQVASEYEEELRSSFQPRADEMPRFDLMLLGLGTDGHTASLFPGTAALLEKEKFCVANWVPKLDAWRITLTFPVINNSAQVMFLVTGADKSEVIRSIRAGDHGRNYPSQKVQPVNGSVVWLLDSAAEDLAPATGV